MKKVLVTGGTSYIGKHCIAQLLNKNYSVSTTIRDMSKSDEIKSEIKAYIKKEIDFNIYEADLLKDDGWNDIIKGQEAIIHVAGPFPVNFDGKEKDLTKPHEDGTLRIMQYAKDNQVNRIILTSSIVSVWLDADADSITKFDDKNWTDLTNQNLDAYAKGKTLKEKAAWDFASKHKSIELTAILPSVVLGPGIGRPMKRGSLEFFQMLINKEMPVAPPFKVGLVDVRDVAEMHISALENDESIGKRMIISENTYWVKDFCKMLNEFGHNAPTFSPPVFLVKFMANFDNTIKPIKSLLGLDLNFDIQPAKEILNYKPIPIEKTIRDTTDYLKVFN